MSSSKLLACLLAAFGLVLAWPEGAQGSGPPPRAAAPAVSADGQQSPAVKAVLLLFPGQADLPHTQLSIKAINAEFQKDPGIRIDSYFEYLDLNRFPGQAYRAWLADFFREKYGGRRIDLVLSPGDLGLGFWIGQKTAILPDSPIVIYDIPPERLASRSLPPSMTAISADVDDATTLRWYLKAMPSVRDVVLVHGIGKTDRSFMKEPDSLKAAAGPGVELRDWSQMPFAEIKRQAGRLPPSSVILYQLMFEDAAGLKYRPIDAIRELVEASAVPVICSYDQFLGTGTIGGYMYSIEQQAAAAARAGLRILRGESPASVHSLGSEANRYTFDHAALIRWRIPLSSLPPGSILVNRQYTFWESYRPQIITVGLGFAALVAIVAFLTRLTWQLSGARNALGSLNAELEARVRARTEELRASNEALSAEIGERRQAEESVRKLLDEKELILKEAHHRVKNNMSTMAALLRLQSSAQKDQAAGTVLQNSASRLESMMVLYDKLYRSDNAFAISLKDYLPSLAEEIVAIVPGNASITLDNQVEDIVIGVKTLSVLGIIMNELITNSLKHAFAGRAEGRISLAAWRSDGRVCLRLEDDGVGLPASAGDSSGFGMRLVEMLVRQIDGTLEIEAGGGGTRVSIELPREA
jgi:two-component sensor histidine kinase